MFQRLVDDLHPECVFRIDLKVAESLVVGHGVIRVLRQILVRPARLVRHLRMTSTCHQCVTKQCHECVTKVVINISPGDDFVCQCVRPSISVSVRLSVCPSICQCVRPSVSVFVRLSVCPSVYQCVRPSVSVSVRPSVSPSVSVSVRPSVSVSVRLSVCSSVCQYVSPSISQSVYQSVRPSVSVSVRHSSKWLQLKIVHIRWDKRTNILHDMSHLLYLISDSLLANVKRWKIATEREMTMILRHSLRMLSQRANKKLVALQITLGHWLAQHDTSIIFITFFYLVSIILFINFFRLCLLM